MNRLYLTPSRVLLPRDSAILTAAFSRSYLLCCFRWLIVVGLSFGHLGAQYISVHPFYTLIRYARSISVLCLIPFAQYNSVLLFLYRLWLFLLLAAYRLSVQSLLIAYFCRCVQCTRYCCRHCFCYSRNGLCGQLFISFFYRYVDRVFRFLHTI